MDRRRRSAWIAASAAAVLGVGHALISAYWAVGGTTLLDTVGGAIAELGRRGGPAVRAGLWAVVVVKLLAVALGLGAVSTRRSTRVRVLSWVAAGVLVAYGGALTAVGLLVQAGVVATAEDADRRALAWHAYLWDPWFLLWGVALLAALLLSRRRPV